MKETAAAIARVAYSTNALLDSGSLEKKRLKQLPSRKHIRYVAFAAPLLALTLSGCETLMGPDYMADVEVTVHMPEKVRPRYAELMRDVRNTNMPTAADVAISYKAVDSTKDRFVWVSESELDDFASIFSDHSRHRNIKMTNKSLKGKYLRYRFDIKPNEQKFVDANGDYNYSASLWLSVMNGATKSADVFLLYGHIRTRCVNESAMHNIYMNVLAQSMEKAIRAGDVSEIYVAEIPWSFDTQQRRQDMEICNTPTSDYRAP